MRGDLLIRPRGGDGAFAVIAGKAGRWLDLAPTYAESLYLIGSNAAGAGFGFLFWTVAAHLYPPGEVGAAGVAISATGWLALFASLGLNFTIVRFLPRSDVIGPVFTLGLCTALLLSSAFVAGLPLLAPALAPLRHDPVFLLSFFVATIAGTITTLMTGIFLASIRARLILVQASVKGVSQVLAATFLASVVRAPTLLAAWALALGLEVLTAAVLLPRQKTFRLRVGLGRSLLAETVQYSAASYAGAMLLAAPNFLLPLLVLNLLGQASSAYFYVAFAIAGVLGMIPNAVSTALFARGAIDDTLSRGQIVAGGKLSASLQIPAVIGVWFGGGALLRLFGHAYSEQATALLRWLAVGTLPMAVNYMFYSAARVRKQLLAIVGSAAWILLVSVGLGAVLLPRLGLLGMGIAWCAAQVSSAGVVILLHSFARNAGQRPVT